MSTPPERIRVSAISSACSPVSGWLTSSSFTFTPVCAAYAESSACSTSMNAATPPRRCASAMMCWAIVVLPDDSGPKISLMRPFGSPPIPRAISSEIAPVGMESIASRSREPSFMIAPRPNCFSMVRIAASTARVRSVEGFPSSFGSTAALFLDSLFSAMGYSLSSDATALFC